MLLLTDAEWEIMNVLWDAESLPLGALRAALAEQGVSWAANTVQTFLTRLEKKGAVTICKTGARHQYRAAVARADCERNALEHLKRTIFRGSASRMLSCLLGEGRPSAEEIAALRRYLDEEAPQ